MNISCYIKTHIQIYDNINYFLNIKHFFIEFYQDLFIIFYFVNVNIDRILYYPKRQGLHY